MTHLRDVVDSYDPTAALDHAYTIPASWYVDRDLYQLESKTVFANTWQLAARLDQLRTPGSYVTTDIAGEPLVIVRGADDVLRAFFNVCRHHAAAVMTEPEGNASQLRCPYHGWTYSLAGELKGTPDFAGVCNFDRASNGLVPVSIVEWENWAFVKINIDTPSLEDYLGEELLAQIAPLKLQDLHWQERRHYSFDCNL